MKYKILKEGKDFIFIPGNTKGSREKKIVVTKKELKTGFLKYERYKEVCSEACSEKLACEIAKVLRLPTANIEFAKDSSGTLGIISFLFIRPGIDIHTDAKDFFNANEFDRKKFCKISTIIKFLNLFGPDEFEKFLDIIVFDALVGETDRHEENWGLSKINGKYMLSPLYDSSCNLLREFRDLSKAQPYYNKEKDLEDFARKSKTCIYKENLEGRYKHFELIEYLYEKYPKIIKEKILNIKRLNRFKLRRIIKRLPNGIITEEHKEYIYKYVNIRKKILLNIIKKEVNS